MKKRIVFFVKKGLDTFLNDVIASLEGDYEVRKVVVTDYRQIEPEMGWADVCWFEWCDDLLIYASNLEIAKNRKILCRLHSYEAFTGFPDKVKWENVDLLIFVAEHIRDFVLNTVKIDRDKTVVIPNGIDLGKYTFKEREKGYNIAYAGYINFKKGPMLLLYFMRALVERDNRYKLYIAGTFQEIRDVLYFKQMIPELQLQNNIVYQGWQNDINSWLEDKNYIVSTSLLESQGMGIMQAMTKGIKPVIHNFVGAKNIYDAKYLWNTLEDAVNMVQADDYNSMEYRDFIKDNYNFMTLIDEVKTILK